MTSPAETSAVTDIAQLTAPAPAVEAYLDQFLDSRPMPANLREAIRYSALGPGKRMRPILVIRGCEAVGGTAEQALAPAAALELIHAFSLVHDDLPAMDDDDLRRGRPTLHKHTSEAMAVLAGDAMMAMAFELVFTQVSPAERATRIASELAAGTNDMIAGQVYDTLGDFDPEATDLERLLTIHRHKTGALIRAAVRMGGLCGGADEEALGALTDYGQAIGLMFQIVDDVLDVTQTTEHLGKTAGKDVAQDKWTYPAVIGLEASRKQIQDTRQQAHAALDRLGAAAEPLRQLCEYLAVRTR